MQQGPAPSIQPPRQLCALSRSTEASREEGLHHLWHPIDLDPTSRCAEKRHRLCDFSEVKIYQTGLIKQRQMYHNSSRGSSHYANGVIPSTVASSMPMIVESSVMTDLVRQRAMNELQEALCMIPVDRKVAYLEALRRAPHLVETESDPMKFFRCEDGNAWNAAQRLVNYWSKRREVFGERAFLPIDLSGEGALSPEDVDHVRWGVYGVLVNESLRGPSIVYVDGTREPPNLQVSLGTRVRRQFFIMQILTDNPESQLGGALFLVRPGPNPSRMLNQITSESLQKAMPLKLKALHMIFLQQNNRNFQEMIVPYLIDVYGPFLTNSMIVHNCDLIEELVEKLESYGISRQILPTSLGGQWSFEADFQRFLVRYGLPMVLPITTIAPAARLAEGGLRELLTVTEQNIYSQSDLAPLGNAGIALATRLEAPMLEAPMEMATLSRMNQRDIAAVVETPTMLERGLASLEEAMQMIPDSDKESYMEAVRRVPHIVQKESNPLRFLRYEKFNPWAAASRLACYWNKRVSAFGERAFRPMTITPESALDEEDQKAIESGFLSLLPNDAIGRSVLYYEPGRRTNHALKTRIRASFYFLTIVMENDVSQTDGFVLMIVLGTSVSGSSALDHKVRVSVDLILDSMPSEASRIHIIYRPPEQRSFFDHILPLALKIFGRMIDQRTQFHVGDSEDELVRKLEAFGISRTGLPDRIGGNKTEKSFEDWMRKRRSEEMQVYVQNVPRSHAILSSDESGRGSQESAELSAQRIMNAMQFLPDEEKAAYLEALNRDADLVRKESDPLRFLRFTNFDAVAAARLLATYWQIRKDIFADRAFLPMDQTGDGTLERKDVGVLQSGYLTQLPNDGEGRSVLCCDGTRLQKSSRLSRLRCTFYMWSVIAENDLSQTEGYSVLYNITEPSFDRANKECLDLIVKSFPAKLKHFHLLGCPPDDTSHDAYVEGPVKDTMELLDAFIQERTVTHVGTSRSDLGRRLEAYGISRDGLPKSLGGKWGFQEFVQWQELRVRHEWGLSIGAGTRNTAEQFNIPTSKVSIDLSESEKNERKRRMNVIHSRRKRERERIEVEVLNEQCIELKDDRSKLRQEGRRLEALVERTRELIANGQRSNN